MYEEESYGYFGQRMGHVWGQMRPYSEPSSAGLISLMVLLNTELQFVICRTARMRSHL